MYYLLLLFALCSSILISAQEGKIPEENWKLAEQYLAQQEGLSGIYLMGSRGEVKLTFAAGYADRGNKMPYSDQTLYTIGSITKPFTATAILLLMDQGKIAPEDPLTAYFQNVPDDKKNITVHQLLTHTAGFPGAIGDDYEAITSLDFQAMAWQAPLIFTPGTAYEYSNVGYSLLGMIIENVSQEKYSDFLQQRIFKPANMQTAGYHRPGVDYTSLAHGYTSDGADWGTSHDKNWDEHEPYWHLKANGGLLMSARDMFQWYLALRSNTILSPALLKLQTTPFADEGGGSFYGYGYAVDPKGECVQHNGSNRIFKADFRWFPKADFFLFSATNDANFRLFRLNDEIIRILTTGEIPVEDQWIEIPAETFPADENQYTAQAFVDLVRSYTDTKAAKFIPEYCSASMIERNGKDRLMELFKMLNGDIDVQSDYKVFSSGEKIMVAMNKKDEPATVKIILTMAGHKIDKLGAEIEGQ